MAVYTDLSDEELAAFIGAYDVGALLSCKGIAEGVENTNFLAFTDHGPHIITLFEKRVSEGDLPFYLGLMDHLSRQGVDCPLPVAGIDGQVIRRAGGRPAALFTFLNGMQARRPGRVHFAELGRATARLHNASADYTMRRDNALNVAGWRSLADLTIPRADEVSPGLAEGIASEIAWLETAWPRDLPEGVIHADLFPDNVFFQGDRLSGIIDFYFACNDILAYELAIVMNAWCFEPDGQFNSTKARDFVTAYHAERPLSGEELAAIPVLARGAALRFLLTRLHDWLNPVPGALVVPKNPLEYWIKLKFHRGVTSAAEYGLYDV